PLKHTRLGQFLIAANRFNQEVSTAKNKENYQREFLQQNYLTYKELCDYDVFGLIKHLAEMNEDHPASQIAVRLQYRDMPKIVRLDHENLKQASAKLQEFKKKHHKEYQDWQLMLIETPQRSYSGEDDPILVLDEY